RPRARPEEPGARDRDQLHGHDPARQDARQTDRNRMSAAATFRPTLASAALTAFATLLTSAAPLRAEEQPAITATTGLAAAEQAYQEVDFATMHDRATRALAAGGATHDETARLYVLDGISAAALGQDDEAKRAFVAALAVDPTLKLDRNL